MELTKTPSAKIKELLEKLTQFRRSTPEHEHEWWAQISALSKAPAAKYLSVPTQIDTILHPHRKRESYYVYGGGATLIFQDEHKVLLENERLKTQLISERRLLMLANQANADLKYQNERLLDGICEVTKVNHAMQAVLIADRQSRICLHETHRGIVTEKVGNQVEITYETVEGPLKQIYTQDQFVLGKLPDDCELIEAHVIMAASEPASKLRGTHEATSDLPSFREKGISGTVEI